MAKEALGAEILRVPHNDSGHEYVSDDFPKALEILTAGQMLEAIKKHQERSGFPPSIRTLARLQLKVEPLDVFESLYRLGDVREAIFEQLYKTERNRYDRYLELRSVVQTLRKENLRYTIADLSKKLGVQVEAASKRLKELGSLYRLGFSSTTPSPDSTASRPDSTERLIHDYANAIRALPSDKPSAVAIAQKLKEISSIHVTPRTVTLFLSQRGNEDFIARAKRGEI